MAKFCSTEAREYPTLGLSLRAGEVVELPEDTSVTGLVLMVEEKKKPSDPVVTKVGE